ncbi:protein LAZY 1-like isoform X2 [Vicia villosa]|uniref:protein LAZY 1-like isoform X2 n=1 Tax=Vicia villosa TaxID=3911 RepID=UPI00273C4698|nr:protein LAZY 1-like isoform X2 [Vicia villosa]
MKLFQWVHRKLQQNSIDPSKDFTLGNPCLTVQLTLESQYSRSKPSVSSVNNHPSFITPHHQESQTSWCREEETTAVISELFEGFLTIGTLGAEAVTNEPATPTFATSLENQPTKDADVTETELKLISFELEKFLEAEEESFYESSGRCSRLSNTTLSEKQTDGFEAEDCGNKAVFPLQGYLLGSLFGIPEKVEAKKERASLAELFQRTKTTDEECIETRVKETQVKHAHKSAMHIMKKMLKMVHSSSKNCKTAGNIADSTTTNTKFSKVLRKFHRKVYPEDTMNAKSVTKSHKGKIKNLPCDIGETTNTDPGRRFHSGGMSKKWFKDCETNWNHSLNCGSSTGKNEHWIKTDTEYLVLEL